MSHIDLQNYFVEKGHETGRPRYDREKLLKIVLFAFMEFGYCSVRFIQKLCETDIRFIWMLDEEEAPSHMTINNFIHNELSGSLEEIFNDINSYMFGKLGVDLEHAYIDGTKIEANANKYTWVWKKGCIKSRNNVFGKLSILLEEINGVMAVYRRAIFEIRQEYAIEYVEYILNTFLDAAGMTTQGESAYRSISESNKALASFAVFRLSGQLFKDRHNILGNLAILCLCSTADTNSTDNFTIHKQRIATGNEGDSWVICLNCHKRSAFCGSTGYIFCFTLCYSGSISLARHECDTQHQSFAVSPIYSRKSAFIADCKANVNTQLFAFFPCSDTQLIAQFIC